MQNYKTITFRLDTNNPLEHKLYDVLAMQQTISARNKLIKDVLARSLIDGSVVASMEVDGDIKDMLVSLCSRIETLERKAMSNTTVEQRDMIPVTQPEENQDVLMSSMTPEDREETQAEPKDEEAPVKVSQEALAFLAQGGFV